MVAKADKYPEHGLADLVKTLVSVIEEKDLYIKEHSDRVASHCVRFCIELGLPKKEIEKIYLAGLLHDIGVVFIPEDIIKNPEKLTDDQMIMVQQVPIISEKILSKHSIFSGILPIIRHHHEAIDGSGYPDGLVVDEIPLAAQILSIINAYDAMVSARPHRTSMSVEEALKEIEKHAGRQFDSTLASAFLKFIRSEKGGSEKKEEDDADETGSVRDIVIRIVNRFKGGEIDLPVLPKVIQEIQKVMKQPTATIDDLANIIEKDGVVSVRLISVVNSPMYRGAERIISVKQAIPRLGVKETQGIVTAIANKSLYRTKNTKFEKIMEKLWLHSLATAYGARAIAQKLMFGDIERFFLMGLTHDIGKAPLLKILTEMFPEEGSTDLDDIITSIQEVHTSFGGAILKRWGFSQEFKRVAIRHEGPRYTSDTEKEILVINLANELAHKIGYEITENDHTELIDLDSARMLQIEDETLNALGEEIETVMKESAQLF